jgi:hypothetical protein
LPSWIIIFTFCCEFALTLPTPGRIKKSRADARHYCPTNAFEDFWALRRALPQPLRNLPRS